jgi:hypothetical protein
MKKKQTKKLVLAKETVRNLEGARLGLAGGVSLESCPCPTAVTQCSCAITACCASQFRPCFPPPTGN